MRPRRARLARRGPFAADAALAAIAGVEQCTLRRLLAALGYRAVVEAGEETFIGRGRGAGREAGDAAAARGRRATDIPLPSCGS